MSESLDIHVLFAEEIPSDISHQRNGQINLVMGSVHVKNKY
ncbi:4650_t:CDS:2 [Paraglomus brasilianum]|uniref:4650_t:CDS:1 n=1 Tax=Paraglomus brasilianum TaxID=144538 RepID=A0A9N9FGC6_9GLOM|nr:4650_t:CDS:2 [Paraglomus brasilianum]